MRVGNGTTIIEGIEDRQTAMKVAELAAVLSVSPKTIYAAIHKGHLTGLHAGYSVRIDPADAATWLRERQYTRRKKRNTKAA